MTAGPLRRITSAIGLIALVPVALLLITGQLTPEAAVLRAGMVLIAVVALGRVARVLLTTLLRRVERRFGGQEHRTPPEGRTLPVADG